MPTLLALRLISSGSKTAFYRLQIWRMPCDRSNCFDVSWKKKSHLPAPNAKSAHAALSLKPRGEKTSRKLHPARTMHRQSAVQRLYLLRSLCRPHCGSLMPRECHFSGEDGATSEAFTCRRAWPRLNMDAKQYWRCLQSHSNSSVFRHRSCPCHVSSASTTLPKD